MLKSLNNLHHAYLVISSPLAAEEYIHSFFVEEGSPLVGSPDFFLYKEALFGIDEARDLSIKAGRKAFTGRKVFLVMPEKITREAQNALLKTFEDPIPDTHFFLVTSGEELILPTLRSRMESLRIEYEVLEDEAGKFIKLSLTERLEFVKKFVLKEKNLSKFLDELLRLTRSKEVFNMRKWSDDRAASTRLILEHLALVL